MLDGNIGMHIENPSLAYGNPHGGDGGESLVAIETEELAMVQAHLRESGLLKVGCTECIQA